MENANWQVELSCDYVEVSGRNVDTALKLRAKAIKKSYAKRGVALPESDAEQPFVRLSGLVGTHGSKF